MFELPPLSAEATSGLEMIIQAFDELKGDRNGKSGLAFTLEPLKSNPFKAVAIVTRFKECSWRIATWYAHSKTAQSNVDGFGSSLKSTLGTDPYASEVERLLSVKEIVDFTARAMLEAYEDTFLADSGRELTNAFQLDKQYFIESVHKFCEVTVLGYKKEVRGATSAAMSILLFILRLSSDDINVLTSYISAKSAKMAEDPTALLNLINI